jgi:hypothetical protein
MKEKQNKHSLSQRVKFFFMHKLFWRAFAIGSAILATAVSGGAAIPVAMLAVTFVASLLDIVGKTRQVQSLEKYRLQKAISKSILNTHKNLRSLNKSHGGILNRLPKREKYTEVHKINSKPPSKTRSFLRTIRDLGLEKSLSIVALASAASPLAVLAYIGSTLFGGYTINSEFKERVKTDFEKDKTKKEINEICKEASIKPYNSTTDLHAQFKEEMVDYETKKRLCKIVGPNHNIDYTTLNSLYLNIKEEVEGRIEFPDVQQSVPFLSKLRDTLNPFKIDRSKQYEDIDIDKVSQYKEPIFSTHSPHSQTIHPSNTPSAKKGRTPPGIN